MVHDVAVAVRADVAVVENHLILVHAGETVLEIHSPFAHRLYLGPLQNHASFESLVNAVVVEGLAVRGHHLFSLFGFGGVTHGHRPSC